MNFTLGYFNFQNIILAFLSLENADDPKKQTTPKPTTIYKKEKPTTRKPTTAAQPTTQPQNAKIF